MDQVVRAAVAVAGFDESCMLLGGDSDGVDVKLLTKEEQATLKMRKIFKMGDSVGGASAGAIGLKKAQAHNVWWRRYRNFRRIRIPGITRNQRSLFIFSKDNFIRRCIRAIVDKTVFEWTILVTIVLNCAVLSMETRLPRNDKTWINVWLEQSEMIFLGIFCIEAVLKIIASGFFMGRGAYLKNMWNIIDFIVVVTGCVPFLFHSSKTLDLRILRAVRVLRPLRLVSSIPSLQVVLRSIFRAMAPLAQIGLLVMFAILIFAIIGLEFYSGIFHQACLNPLEDGIYENHDFRPCPASMVYQKCLGSGNSFNDTLICIDGWKGPNYGISNFDNIGFAMLTVFQCITMEGWVPIMYWVGLIQIPLVQLFIHETSYR